MPNSNHVSGSKVRN